MTKRNGRKRHFVRRRRPAQLGVAPGTIESLPGAFKPKIRAIAYGPDDFHEQTIESFEQVKQLREKWPTVWIHVEGLGDAEAVSQLGEIFSLHKLALEDVVGRNQHPKLEEYEDHLFLVAHAVPEDGGLNFGQANIFVGESFVLTLQEREIDWDGPVRKRIRAGRTRIRTLGANYLAYALLDSIVDCYFPVLEQYDGRLETLEEEVLISPAQDKIVRVHEIRNELLSLRRALAPFREMAHVLSKTEMQPIAEETRLFFRDCFDHIAHLIDAIETHREVARGLIDLCISGLSNRMNEVMKVLTIIATIFIPLGFIAGLYGMNFNPERSPFNMPELSWYFGYPFALSLMGVTAIVLMIYFRRKGWLGGSQ